MIGLMVVDICSYVYHLKTLLPSLSLPRSFTLFLISVCLSLFHSLSLRVCVCLCLWILSVCLSVCLPLMYSLSHRYPIFFFYFFFLFCFPLSLSLSNHALSPSFILPPPHLPSTPHSPHALSFSAPRSLFSWKPFTFIASL